MAEPRLFLLAALTLAEAQVVRGPDTVAVRNGPLTLGAMLWRPQGRGPFPAVPLNHGSGRTRGELERLGPCTSGRRMYSDRSSRAAAAGNALQLQLLENAEMSDALSGLALLRALPEVDARNVAVVGHSFGGSLHFVNGRARACAEGGRDLLWRRL